LDRVAAGGAPAQLIGHAVNRAARGWPSPLRVMAGPMNWPNAWGRFPTGTVATTV
jgi:hypothetical protein